MSRWVTKGAIAMMTGMALSAWTGERAVVFLLFGGVGMIIACSLFRNRERSLIGIFSFCALSGGMFLYAHIFERWQQLPESNDFSAEVIVIERGEAKVFYRPMILRPIEDHWPGGDILYSAPIDAVGMAGEKLHFACLLSRPKNFEPGFDYPNLLASRGIGYACDRGGRSELLPSEDFSFRKFFASVQSRFQRAITTLIPEPEAGLLSGLLIGGSDTLAPETKAAFARAGLSHIVAVSGYNMSVVAEGLVILALILGAWRKWAVGVAVVGLAFFLLLIDGSAASLRAALMAWLAFGAYFVGRPTASWNGLLLAGVVMLLFNPLLIRYDVGFQLSFLATLALLFFARSFETFDFFRPWYGKLSALFLTTVIIELFTLPVIVSTFGTLSLIAPLANVVILPLVPIAMFVGIGAVAITVLFPALSFLVLPFIWLPLTSIIRLAEAMASSDWVSLSDLDSGPTFAVLWYVGLGGAVYALEHFRKRYVLGMDH